MDNVFLQMDGYQLYVKRLSSSTVKDNLPTMFFFARLVGMCSIVG
jgi:hypothetical protein